jgi:hypothetical protein
MRQTGFYVRDFIQQQSMEILMPMAMSENYSTIEFLQKEIQLPVRIIQHI